MTWKGLIYNSNEECRIVTNENTVKVNSAINGRFQDNVFSLNYTIITNLSWETIYFAAKSEINGKSRSISYSSDGRGNWSEDGKFIKEFTECIDIDIQLTPFTNTLPINRLRLATNDEVQIKVLYIDILEQTEAALNQKYKRLSTNSYKYQNVPNDFEAIISVDQEGFVTDYPGLFKSIVQ